MSSTSCSQANTPSSSHSKQEASLSLPVYFHHESFSGHLVLASLLGRGEFTLPPHP